MRILLLTPSATLDTDVASAILTHRTAITEVRYLGGPGAVRPQVRDEVADLLD